MAYIQFTYLIEGGGLGAIPALKLQVGDEVTDGLGTHTVSKILIANLVNGPLPTWQPGAFTIKHTDSAAFTMVSWSEMFIENDTPNPNSDN